MAAVVACTKCAWPVPAHFLNLDHPVDCPMCGSALQVRVFPALFHRTAPVYAEMLRTETEASCFYHPENRALVACDACGRFICGLCRMEISRQSVCPGCVESGIRTGKLIALESRRTMYDTVALALATIPTFLIWPTILTAPAAIFVAVRHWRTSRSLAPRTKIRFILAILLALLQIVLWVLIAILLAGRVPWATPR
jgi:hypothetical protein